MRVGNLATSFDGACGMAAAVGDGMNHRASFAHHTFFVSLVSLVVLGGCAGPAPSNVAVSEDELGTTYGSFIDTLHEGELDAWLLASRKLRDGFDRLCGDTICSGDFSNLATVRLTCSSTRAQRKMKDCVWVLAGNVDHIDATTGAHTVDARSFVCSIPVAGNAPSFLEALAKAGDDALLAPLPGTSGSFYDALVACFAGVTATPPAPRAAAGEHVELGDLLWQRAAEKGAAWSDTQRNLAAAFDDACGDAFCEGGYPDVTALRLSCDVRRSDERVGTCHWTFAMADSDVDSRGRIRSRTATTTCAIPVDAPVSALTAALAGADALHAPLPGRPTSLYDALIGCL